MDDSTEANFLKLLQELDLRNNELELANEQLSFEKIEKAERAKALVIANKELAFQNNEKAERAAVLIFVNKELLLQRNETAKRTEELLIANNQILFERDEKAKQAAYLLITNKELLYERDEKAKRVAELNTEIANVLQLTHELELHQMELKASNDELNLAIEQTETVARKYAGLYDFAPTGYFTLSNDGTIIGANINGAKMLGKEPAFLVNSRYGFFVSDDTKQIFTLFLEKAFRSKAKESCEITLTSSGNQPVFAHLTGIVTEKGDQCLVTMVDITSSRQSALYKEIHHEVHEILNESGALYDAIPRLIDTLKIKGGFDAVGIRLQDGDDFPYFAQNGFLTDFLSTENTLVCRTKDGGLCRGKNGDISLECFCGLVISGNADPGNPLFTARGSFWTNDSFPFLSISSDEDPRLHPRNVCVHHGYASMALIPIKNTSRNIGLIQFNDRRKDFFTPDLIGILEGIASHIGDVLMRKKAEDELQESERQYRILVENSPVGILIGQGANFRYVNQQMAEITGYSVEELMMTPFMDLVYPEDRETVKNNYQKRQKGEAVDPRYHFRIVKKDGCLAWIEINGSKTEWKGEPAVINFVSDITKRKQAEAVRLELEAKHSSMISHISEVIGIIGADGFMKYKSPNMEQWFGWQPEDLIGTDGWLTVHPDDLQRIQKEFYSLLEDASLEKTLIYRYKCKDGSYKPIELTATNHLKDPAINGILLNYRDITERQEAEEELKLMNAELKKLNVEKDKFFSIVSHDLRSPFQALLGYFPLTMEIIKTYPLEKIQLLLMNMRNSSENLYVMVENLLEWSKMQQGLIGFSPSSIRLKEVISEVLVIIRKSSDKKMIKISCDIPEHLVVTADKRMLESILNNLIFNAVKFTNKNGKITISAMVIPGNFVGISIEDTGIGMNKDMIDRLFHLDADISTKGTEGEYSTGLGLFICKDFVKKHGGRIWVESEEGKGSTFQFALPGKANDLSVFSFSPGMKKGN